MKEPGGIAAAIKQAGSQEKLAEKLGVTQQMVSAWKRRGWVPPHRALEIEAVFGTPRKSLLSPRLSDLIDLPGGDE